MPSSITWRSCDTGIFIFRPHKPSACTTPVAKFYACEFLCSCSDDINFDNPRSHQADEAAYIWDVEQVDKAVEHLTLRRTTLLQRLNAFQASTGAIPQEILPTFFEHACWQPIDITTRSPDTEPQ